MTRINTNISSLTAQKTLARSNDQLQTALTRLSTGLRINVGKDDPAGLIASEALRSDMISTQTAISNTQRANQMIATADSALGQVSSLLNDIRGLISQAANKGALSDAQISANQLQIDSSLDAINRIAQLTNFQGRRLLDGSLDFVTGNWTNDDKMSNLQIQQANLGTSNNMGVTVHVDTAATQGQITATIPDSVAASKATSKIDFADGDYLTVTAHDAGAAGNSISVQIVETDQIADGGVLANYDANTSKVTVYVSDTADTLMADVETAVNNLTAVDAVYTQNGAADAKFSPGSENVATATLTTGADAVTGLTGDLVVEIGGAKGSQAFTFKANTTGAQIAAAIQSVSDATGVTAEFAANTLTLTASDYGSNGFVAVNVISDAGSFTPSDTRVAGDDVIATVNGVNAKGDGNNLSISTASLSMSAAAEAAFTGDITFDITGGGALFQLGPEVVSNQQARMGIQSVNTASLGGTSGRLYELGSGSDADLVTDATTAANIVSQVISKVTSLRGRLGAFQKATLDSNVASLTDTLQNLTAAESSIRDADFASESANLTRAQILVQSGTAVLQIANQSPQNVLALLRG